VIEILCDQLAPDERSYYILVGDIETWKTAIMHKVWGFSDRSKGYWNTANIDDYLSFYVTSPVKKIVGFGTITDKYIDNNKIWPYEFFFNRSIWKYRFRFRIFYVLEDWDKGVPVSNDIILNVGRKKIEQGFYYSMVSKAEKLWRTKIICQ
jgi:hypothetical protein